MDAAWSMKASRRVSWALREAMRLSLSRYCFVMSRALWFLSDTWPWTVPKLSSRAENFSEGTRRVQVCSRTEEAASRQVRS